MVLGRSLLERVEERSRQRRQTVVEVAQLHYLEVGICPPTENRRVVRGGLAGIDASQRNGEGGHGESLVRCYRMHLVTINLAVEWTWSRSVTTTIWSRRRKTGRTPRIPHAQPTKPA